MKQINVGAGAVLAVGVLAVGALLWFKRGAVLSAVNPLNQDNLANTGFNKLTEAVGLTNKDETIGTKAADAVAWIKDLFSPTLHPAEKAAQILTDPSAVLQHCRLAFNADGAVKTTICKNALAGQPSSALSASAVGLLQGLK